MQLCNRQLMFSIWSHPLQMTLNLLMKKHWWLFTMERRRHWIPFAWLATVKKSPRALPKLNQEVFPPQVLLQNTTATESFSKYASGKAMNVTCPQSYGDGILLMESSIPQQQIFLQLPLTCWKSFIVIAQLTAARPDVLVKSMEWSAHWHVATAMDQVAWMQSQSLLMMMINQIPSRLFHEHFLLRGRSQRRIFSESACLSCLSCLCVREALYASPPRGGPWCKKRMVRIN